MAIKPETQDLLCAFKDRGEPCLYKGIWSFSTFGGPWYCRQHSYQMKGYHGMEGKVGNELPEPLHSQAIDDIRKRLKKNDQPAPLTKYLPRLPGQDDEEVIA